MYICTLSKSLVHESPHVAQFPPLYPMAIPQWAIEEPEANFVLNSTAFAWHLARFVILGLCNERTWTDTCLAWHCEGVACKTLRLEPRLSVGLTPRAKRMFARNSGCQKRHRTVLMFLLQKQQNNNDFILRVRVNCSTKLASFAGKGRCTN